MAKPGNASSKGLQTKSAILDAALAIASRDGLEGLSIGMLAEALGMSKSGVFAHFGSREELQIAVIDEYARRFMNAVFHPAIGLPRGLPRLAAMFENWLHRVQTVEIPNGCVFISGAVEFDDRDGPVRERMVTVNRGWQGEMQKAARQAIDCGHLVPACDPEQLVFELYGVMLALHHDARLLRDARAVERARRAFDRIIAQHTAAEAPPARTRAAHRTASVAA
ncbi:MAG: TetR/AcrR family transcriptional regulator [Burkholderiales bacterium]|nr:TetR/AcrR family transcriptional regulator [Burkholderiales bacterium]